jgi:hypothetical protein
MAESQAVLWRKEKGRCYSAPLSHTSDVDAISPSAAASGAFVPLGQHGRADVPVNWDQEFAGLPPIELPDGRKLETLRDLRSYILALPKREQLRWTDAVAALLKAAERGGGWPFFARLAFSRTLHAISGVEPPPAPRDKNAAWKEKRARRKQSP